MRLRRIPFPYDVKDGPVITYSPCLSKRKLRGCFSRSFLPCRNPGRVYENACAANKAGRRYIQPSIRPASGAARSTTPNGVSDISLLHAVLTEPHHLKKIQAAP